jgi:hypothetical protein
LKKENKLSFLHDNALSNLKDIIQYLQISQNSYFQVSFGTEFDVRVLSEPVFSNKMVSIALSVDCQVIFREI